MLGLGINMTGDGLVGGLPPISDLTLSVVVIDSTGEDSGDSLPPNAETTLFDLRISEDAEYTGNPSDYTVTSITAKNNTTGSTATELLSGDLTMDSVVDVLGVGALFYVFDNNSPMDDIDFGSASGSPHAHDGSGVINTYAFVATITVNGYEGEATVTSTINLDDSDA